jgi:general secretion pathway protein L
LRLQVLGEPGHAQVVMSGQGVAGGVLRLPLATGSLLLGLGQEGLPEHAEVLAEPAAAGLAEEVLQHKAELQLREQRLVIAAQTPWDMAQFDLASGGRVRTVKRLLGAVQTFLRAPQWRAARWGFGLLLVANLVGLNAWAWKEQASLRSRRDAIQSTLTRSFPAVKVVVDAPVQMAREVATLRQATGAPSTRDFEAILAAAGAALPSEAMVTAIEFAGGEARLKGLKLGTEEISAVVTKLGPLGYLARIEGEILIISPGPSS